MTTAADQTVNARGAHTTVIEYDGKRVVVDCIVDLKNKSVTVLAPVGLARIAGALADRVLTDMGWCRGGGSGSSWGTGHVSQMDPAIGAGRIRVTEFARY